MDDVRFGGPHAARLWLLSCMMLLLGSAFGCSTPADIECPGQTRCGDECHDVLSDASNCGACGVVCDEGELCVSGECDASCPPGQKVCDGRCVDVLSSRENCGSCGKSCKLDEMCSSGACSTECGGLTPYECAGGCVDVGSDRSHCGRCGNACAADQVCSNGVCASECGSESPKECGGRCVDTGSDPLACGDCDTECDVDQVCDHGKCTSACTGSEPDRCGRKCLDLQTSHSDCGACGHACAPGDLCSGGQCQGACGHNTPNACGLDCVDWRTDPLNCGECGNACPGDQVCVDGKCADECSGSRPLRCDGQCVNPASDPRFCGACDVKCDEGTVCSGGRCVAECDGLTATACGDLCVDTFSDPSFCGDCGKHCKPGAVCTGGNCGSGCTVDGLTQCGDACVDLRTNVAHCGACNAACAVGQFCSEGKCTTECAGSTPLQCGGQCASLDDADKCGLRCFGATPDRCGDGCFDLKSESKHCGKCDVACGAGQACEKGKCTTVCSEDAPALCGGKCVDTLTDTENCGACGVTCEAFQRCAAAKCTADIVSVSSAGSVTCVTLVDGRVGCFGYNSQGRLGDMSISPYVYGRTLVKGLPEKVLELHVGGTFACALLESGTLECWGENTYGELGVDPAQIGWSALPLAIDGLPASLRMFAVGMMHGCVVAEDGGVWCWGRNSYGQLGDGASVEADWTPAEVAGVAHDVVGIAAAQYHTCVRHDWPDASVTCWGRNGAGQVGTAIGSDPFARVAPTLVAALPKPAANVALKHSLAIGHEHSCAIAGEGDVYCWGSNYIRQIGIPDASELFPAPTKVPGLPLPATYLFADAYATCAILSDESLWCWGDFGGVGTADPTVATNVLSDPVVAGDLGEQVGIVLLEDGSAVTFGEGGGDLQGRVVNEVYRPGACCGDW